LLENLFSLEKSGAFTPTLRSSKVFLILISVCLLSTLALFGVNPKIIAAIVGLPIMAWAVWLTSSQTMWLLVPLTLIEAVTASKFLGEDNSLSAFIRYPMVLLFCAPVLPALWRSGLLKKGGFLAYAIYFLWALVSVSYSPLPYISLGRLISSFLPFCAIVAIVSQMKDGEDARRAMGVMLVGCGVVVLANFDALLLLSGDAYYSDPETGMDRFTGIFTEPNEVGGLMLATIGAAFCYWPLAKGYVKTLCICAVFGAVLQGAMADSRSPFVGLAVGGVAYLLWKYGVKSALAIAALGSLLYLAIKVSPNGSQYFTRGEVTSVTGRDVAWSFAIRSIEERPIRGYGYEIEGMIFQSPYFNDWEQVWDQGPRSSVHNGYIARAVGLGVPALLLWLFLMFRPALNCFRTGYDPWVLNSIVPLAFVPVMILNLTESISDCRSLSGILLALSWAILERERLFAYANASTYDQASDPPKTSLVRALTAS
jgi:hypothetical protein